MDVRAAVAFEPGKPLEVTTVSSKARRPARCWSRSRRPASATPTNSPCPAPTRRACFPAILGHEGAGVVVDVGPGVTSVKKGDHVIPLYTPECRQCPSCLSRKTNLCTAIRATQGQGVMPDGTSRFSLGGKKLHHYMGCSTFANFTVLPEIAVAKIREDAPFDKVCYIGCGVTTGIGAVHQHRQGRARRQGDRVRARRHRAQRHPGPAARRRRHDHRRRHQQRQKEWGERFGMTHFVNPKEVGSDLVPYLVDMTKQGADQIGGADYTFDCTGNVTVMRQALEALPPRLGRERHHRRRRRRPGNLHAAVPAGHRPGLEGHRLRRRARPHRRSKIVDWYMDGKIEIDPMITHTMPLADINKGFDLMHEGKSIRSVVVYLARPTRTNTLRADAQAPQ